MYEAYFFWVWLHVRGRLLDGGSQPGTTARKDFHVSHIRPRSLKTKNTIQDRSSTRQSTSLTGTRWPSRSCPQIVCSHLRGIASQSSGVWRGSAFISWCRVALKSLCLRIPVVRRQLLRRWCFDSKGRMAFFIARLVMAPVLVALLPLPLTGFCIAVSISNFGVQCSTCL